MINRILFCLKFREGYWGQSGSDLSSGLKNSVTFITDMLNNMGYTAKIVQLADNNKIDAAIATFNPDLVVLEALWVVPTKLDVLIPKWPHVQWAVRNHSDIPFIANEGIATDWLYGYLSRGVQVMNNDPKAVNDMQTIAWAYGNEPFYNLITYAPNFYPLTIPPEPAFHHGDNTFDVCSFGAIRPLKNQLTQAVAALQFCMQSRRYLRFHINSVRVEQSGDPILKNIRNLFAHTRNAELVEHTWLDHDSFLNLMTQMDYAMCVSFSETFCICAADAVATGVPVIGSAQIPWIGDWAIADPVDTTSMTWKLLRAEKTKRAWVYDQWDNLADYNHHTKHAWQQLLR